MKKEIFLMLILLGILWAMLARYCSLPLNSGINEGVMLNGND